VKQQNAQPLTINHHHHHDDAQLGVRWCAVAVAVVG